MKKLPFVISGIIVSNLLLIPVFISHLQKVGIFLEIVGFVMLIPNVKVFIWKNIFDRNNNLENNRKTSRKKFLYEEPTRNLEDDEKSKYYKVGNNFSVFGIAFVIIGLVYQFSNMSVIDELSIIHELPNVSFGGIDHIFSAIIGIIGGIVTAIIFRYILLSKESKIFRQNSNEITNILFRHIHNIDSNKDSIYSYIDNSKPVSDNTKITAIINELDQKQIDMHLDNIQRELNNIMAYDRYSTYLSVEQYRYILQYVHSFISSIRCFEDTSLIYIIKTELEYHRYYAKKIIQTFGKFTDENFKTKWYEEFDKNGGIDNTQKPKSSRGTIVTHHFNINNEVMNHNSSVFLIKEKLTKIDDRLANIQDELTNLKNDSSNEG